MMVNMKKIYKKIIIILLILAMINSYIVPLEINMVYAAESSQKESNENEEKENEKEIVFGNQKIKEYILANCDFDENKKITESDMIQIEDLDFRDLYQEDIDFTGLEYAKNLKSLQIENPGINISNPNNVEVFKNFKKLEKISLRLDYQNLQDVSSLLSSLTSLKVLDIWHADLTKVDFSKLNQIEELYVGDVRLNSVKQISALDKLIKISIYNSYGLTDYENLPINNLQDLSLENADINKINLNANNNKIINLYLQNCQINDISFLQDKTKIEYLHLDNNNIEDISTLSFLPNLTELSLNSNKIKDISVLNNLSNLNTLYLRNNYITDILPIKDLKKLQYVDLSQNPINPNNDKNAEVIKILENRQAYVIIDDVDQSQIIEFKDKNLEQKIIEAGYDYDKNGKITVHEMEQIYYLSLYDYENPLTDISDLRYAVNLNNLGLTLNTKDISVLSNLKKLTNLSISSRENKIDDVTALANLTNLEYLSLGETDIKDISPLKNLTKLIDFTVYSNKNEKNNDGIKDISVIANFTRLQYLDISGQSFSDISSIVNLNDLKFIRLSNNKITDLSAIKNLENLECIWLSSNNIEDISSILEWKCLNKVTDLELNSNEIKDISLLPNIMTKLTKITDFWLQNNCFEDISVINQLKKLNNYSSLKFGELQYSIDLGKIERNSIQQIKLPKAFSQVNEIYTELDWNTHVYDRDDWINNLDANINGNVYNVDTSHIGHQEIIIDKYGDSKNHNNSQNAIDSIKIRINFVIEVEGNKNKNITFEDKNLNRVILENYDIDGDKKITENDILNLTNIDISENDIRSLKGIEQAVNLRNIEAYNNKIRDISPLMNLENLVWVGLYCNEITDITCLKDRKFKHIQAIDCENNYIDFSNNSSNTMTYLNEWKKEVEKNGKAIYYLEGKELLCSLASGQKHGLPDDTNKIVNMDNKIKQAIIKQLQADTNDDGELTREEMYNAKDYDSNNHNQITLDLSNLNLNSLSGLEYLTNISSIDISNNQISDIEPLKYLFNLTELNASNNNIESIDNLPYYKSNYIKNYNFANNKISDISCLENWVGCYSTLYVGFRSGGGPNERTVQLNFSNNNIKDISIVKNLKCLAYLNLNNNKITDISSLKDYNFIVEPEFYEEDDIKEQLEQFKGIYLKGNEIDPEDNGNKAAINLFKAKGVKLLLDSDFKKITIKDENTNIQITTIGEKTARVQVEEIQQDSTEYKEINEQLEKLDIVCAMDISIVDGEYEGKINITIPLDEAYNNKFVKIIHKKSNGKIEEFIRKVSNSSVSIDVNELSPFYIAYSENLEPKGDINRDKKVNIKDWNRMYEHISGKSKLNEKEFEAGDINGDEKVNIKDWNRLYEHISGINPLY